MHFSKISQIVLGVSLLHSSAFAYVPYVAVVNEVCIELNEDQCKNRKMCHWFEERSLCQVNLKEASMKEIEIRSKNRIFIISVAIGVIALAFIGPDLLMNQGRR